MRICCLAATLPLLLAATGAATPEEDLKFAQILGRRGLEDMAVKVLDDLESSPDADAKRLGRYGKALLTKQRATILRHRFIWYLGRGRTPEVDRAEVLEAYGNAGPKIQDYVDARPDDIDARFLLGELLQEHAEFLVGSEYPEEMKEERARLLSENSDKAEKLFERAIENYKKTEQALRDRLGDDFGYDLDDPDYIRASRAQYNAARARMRWAFMYPGGAKFNYRSGEAIEQLDEFQSEHYNDAFGLFALRDLGETYYERAMREKSAADAAEYALTYFDTLCKRMREEPNQEPALTRLLANAFYWYTRACNDFAEGKAASGEAQPILYERTIRAGTDMKQRLDEGLKLPDAMRALINVADAYAATNRFQKAVEIAGEVLGTARVTGESGVAKKVTASLTRWVANVAGAGSLDPALLLQVGESLAGQGRTANAITFLSKAVAASKTPEEKRQAGYPARLRIAEAYLADKRYFAAAEAAWLLVDEYLKSGKDEETPFGQVASDACNVARLAWRSISEKTKRSQDQQRYQQILTTFRETFPGHRENSDAAYSQARDLYRNKQFVKAAQEFREISPTSKSYWRAQRLVPTCYRRLAGRTEDEAERKKWHEKTLEAARNLEQLAEPKAAADEDAKRSVQQAKLYEVLSLCSLERWKEALPLIDEYLARYPDQFLANGYELKYKIDAHLALGQLAEAEKTLATLRKQFPGSSIEKASLFDVSRALKAGAADAEGEERMDMLRRAADYFGAWLETVKKPSAALIRFHADLLRSAERYGEAADQYNRASGLVGSKGARDALTLSAAEMKYEAARELDDRRQYLKEVEAARKLFTDYLIKDKEKQQQLLKALSERWLRAGEWDQFKKNPRAFYMAAKVYAESTPAGLDGRWIAVRMSQYLTRLIKPAPDPEAPQYDEHVDTWWDAALLQANTLLEIAKSGRGANEKKAASRGRGAVKRWLFQHPQANNKENLKRLKELEREFDRLD